jgi:formate hydrogenlyase transcriptional activator
MHASPKDEPGKRPTLVEDRRRNIHDRRVAEGHLRLFIDTTPALLHSGLPDGYLDFFNQRWLEYLGLSLDDICGWRWTDTIHRDDVEEFVQKWRSSLATGEPFEAEARVRRADGEYRAFLHRKVPLRNGQGSITKWYGSSIDIEDRKSAEEELRRSEFYLGEGERLAHAGSWAFNPSGFFDHWSQELFQIYGLDPAEGAPTLERYLASVHPEDREFMACTIERMVAGCLGCDVKKRIVRTDGELRYIRCVGVPVFDNKSLKQIVGTAMDVTEEEHLTRELRRREEYLAEAQRLSHTGSFGWNVLSGDIVWSDETFRIFEFDRAAKPTLDKILQLVHPDDRARVQEVIDRASSDEANFEIKYRLLMADGIVKHLDVVAHAMKDETGNVEFVGAVTDTTEQHKAGAALEKAFEEIQTLKDQLYKENLALKEEIDQTSMFEEIIGSSAALRRVLVHVSKVAPTDSTVLVTGETGTGKELVARAIHRRSRRATHAFVSVNCAAIAPSLIASELFGYEKGAFTGAGQRRLGRFELADRGTLFLDEVGELPPDTQVTLLRVLQERAFERVGGSQQIAVNVRLLAATNRDLQAAVEAGTFRRDLYYRLNVFPIHVPPLRDRVEDIPLLVEYLTERYANKTGKKIRSIKKATLELFQTYDWPGNIRELQNVIERAVILCEEDTLAVDETWLQGEPSRPGTLTRFGRPDITQERETIETVLKESGGRVSGPLGAAAKLGIPRSTLESKIRSLQINKHRFKSG